MKVEIQNVSKVFRQNGSSISVLEDISLTIEEGEFVCLVGPSGCGKSTLLNMIAGLDFPTQGTIQIDESSVKGPGHDRVVVFQEPALFPWLTVLQNVEFGLKALGVSKSQRRDQALELVRTVHLGRFINSYSHELSGGMKQRVAIARALAMNPSILLMDEPFGALDAQTRSLLQAELQEIWNINRKTIFFVTHNVREAICLADKIYVISARPGRIKKEYRVEFARPRAEGNANAIPLHNRILEALRDEIEKVAKEEMDIDYVFSKGGVLQPTPRDLGSHI